MKSLGSIWIILISTLLLAACTPTGESTTSPQDVTKEERLVLTETATPEIYRPKREILPDVLYLPDGGTKQILDLYLPIAQDAAEKFPIVMMIHQGGSDRHSMSTLALDVVDQGFAVISIDHREPPKYQYPTHIEDAVCALGWIYSNAETYGFDLEKIFLLGYSTGGAMVAFLGTVDHPGSYAGSCPDTLPEIVSLAGVITYTGDFDYPLIAEGDARLAEYVTGLMGADYATAPELWQEASPITWIDGREPEFLLFHGEGDGSILPAQSILFAKVLEAAGVEATLHLIPDVGHMELIQNETAYNLMMEFLRDRAK